MKRQIPTNAIPGESFVRKEEQCDYCTHYKSEHVSSLHQCGHVIFYIPQDDFPGMVSARQLCDCKEFKKK